MTPSSAPSRRARGEGRLMNEFLFDRSKQRLCRSVVPAVGLAAHAAANAELGQPLLEVIAGILNRQGRKTATGERFTANTVGNLRRYRDIPRFQPPAESPSGEVVTIRKAAQILGLNTSTIHRWLADGFIAGEQVTPGAPWQIRITDELRARIVAEAPPDYLPMLETTIKLGVSRQTVLQRVKRGELQAMLVTQGRRKGAGKAFAGKTRHEGAGKTRR